MIGVGKKLVVVSLGMVAIRSNLRLDDRCAAQILAFNFAFEPATGHRLTHCMKIIFTPQFAFIRLRESGVFRDIVLQQIESSILSSPLLSIPSKSNSALHS